MNSENTIPDFSKTPFIPFTSDYGFKVTFGNESDTRFLRKALQALIQSEHPILSVKFIKTDFTSLTLDGRSGVFDMSCTDSMGNHFIVEMQVSRFPDFIHRMKFYAFHRFNIMVKKGNFAYEDIQPIYCIGILSHKMYPFEGYYHIGQLKNQNGEVMDERLTYITVELDKFNIPQSAIHTDLEKLIYTMKNLNTVPDTSSAEQPEFWTEEWLNSAIQELDTRRFTPEEYAQYMMVLEKNANVIHSEKKRLNEAREETKKEVITNLLSDGHLSDEKIAICVNVPLEYVLQIKADLGL